MFKRLSYDDWQSIVPIIAFVLTFGVFLIQLIRAVLMKRPKADRLASLPLESEHTTDSNPADHEKVI